MLMTWLCVSMDIIHQFCSHTDAVPDVRRQAVSRQEKEIELKNTNIKIIGKKENVTVADLDKQIETMQKKLQEVKEQRKNTLAKLAISEEEATGTDSHPDYDLIEILEEIM